MYVRLEARQVVKKKTRPTPSNITLFLGSVAPYGKYDPHQKKFEKDLGAIIIKQVKKHIG
jgi:hypothetical protein